MGCAWLLDRWGELRDVLEAGQKLAGRRIGSRRSGCWAVSRWTWRKTPG